MKQQETIRATVTFVVIFIAGVLMIVGASQLAPADQQPVLYALGSALSGAALTFFLLEMFRIDREKGR